MRACVCESVYFNDLIMVDQDERFYYRVRIQAAVALADAAMRNADEEPLAALLETFKTLVRCNFVVLSIIVHCILSAVLRG